MVFCPNATAVVPRRITLSKDCSLWSESSIEGHWRPPRFVNLDSMSSSSIVRPLTSLRVSKHQIPAFHGLPNTSIQSKPLFIYHSAFTGSFGASDVEAHLREAAVVSPAWRYTMYSETHFHSTSHEVLSITSGRAKCCFGGEHNPDRVEVLLNRGDVVIVPAGVAHRLLEDHGGFQMVGSYPISMNWDMCYGRKGEEKKVDAIKDLKWFERDPVYGDTGPVLDQ